jgi:hypothetical protein
LRRTHIRRISVSEKVRAKLIFGQNWVENKIKLNYEQNIFKETVLGKWKIDWNLKRERIKTLYKETITKT